MNEAIRETIRRQMRDLSETLARHEDGRCFAVVHATTSDSGNWLGSRENLGPEAATPIQQAYQRYRSAFNAVYGDEAGDEMLELYYAPEHAELDIATLNFWNAPCLSMQDVHEKVGFVRQSRDLSDDITMGAGRHVGRLEHGYQPVDLFFASLRGETVDLESHFAEIRMVYAELRPAELEEWRLQCERRQQGRANAERKNSPKHPEDARLEAVVVAACHAWSAWRRENRDLVSE